MPGSRPRPSQLLTDPAYRERALPALRLARSSRVARRIAMILLALLVVTVIAMLFAPWRQTVRGSGEVIAYAPVDRQQVIEAPIKGRVTRWGDGIYENALVQKGQVILEIQDLDPGLLARLQQQEAAAERQVEANRRQKRALERQLTASRTIIPAYEAQVAAFETVREQTLAAADEYIRMAAQKVKAEEQNLEAARAALAQARADFERQQKLFDDGLASQLKFQTAEQKYRKAQADVEKSQAYLESARNELEAKKKERTAKERELQAKIESVNGTLRKTESEVAKAESDLAKAESELGKAEKELLDVQVKLARQRNQVVRAPRDGYVLDLQATEGAMLKEGDRLCRLVPETSRRAVQLWVDGNDVPLIAPGRHVRLQFEGWPAVQFAGWPSVAVGTFGGTVASVDATDDGRGRFRVLLLPDEDSPDWPSERFLRQGTRANGWILLSQVSLGYEFWRKLNGFPPVSAMQAPGKSGKSDAEASKEAVKSLGQ